MGARARLPSDQEIWAFQDNRIAVRFAYEWHDDSENWFRSFGNENWEFDEHGLMTWRQLVSTICQLARMTESITGRSVGDPTIIPG